MEDATLFSWEWKGAVGSGSRTGASRCPDRPHPITRNWGQVISLRKTDPEWLVAQKGQAWDTGSQAVIS